MLRLARGITALNRWIGRTVAWLILPMFVMLLADVVMRYFVGRPAIWTSELTQLVFGVYAVIAGGYLMAERGHVNVDILYGRLSRKRKAGVDVATSALFFMFLIVLVWQGTSLAYDSVIRLETSNSIWNPPIWPIKLVVPIAGILLLLQGCVRLAADIRILRGLPVDEATFGRQAEDDPPKGEAVPTAAFGQRPN